jgi:sugar phosphate isomerase/epimerase
MIYTSTGCLKNPKNILNVLNKYQEIGIKDVELGSVHSYFEISELKKFDFNYTVHNYFPPPKIPFNFNLASQDKKIKKKSIQLAKNAINFCRKIDSPLYTFHAGFTVDPKRLGSKFDYTNIPKRTKSIISFLDSVLEIIDCANAYKIKIAMEPNVVQKFNLVNNKNKLLLFAELDEIEILFKFFEKNELGILLDLGHTSVTSHWLKFNKDHYIKKLKNKVSAIHISNNNGLKDQHKSLTENCWQVNVLKQFKNTPIILESMNLTPKEIFNNLEIIKSKL